MSDESLEQENARLRGSLEDAMEMLQLAATWLDRDEPDVHGIAMYLRYISPERLTEAEFAHARQLAEEHGW